MNYKLAYAIGFHPWEDAERHAPFVEKINEMFDREEKQQEAPYGPVLDLGCGSGVWGVNLARRGWKVTSIDIVDKALKRAQARIDKEGVKVNLLKEDVTKLNPEHIGSHFKFILDTGTYHGLPKKHRAAMGQAVDIISDPDTTLLLLVWDPKNRGPLPGGASRQEIELNFPKWNITNVEPADANPPSILKALKANEHWYRLRRK